MIYECNQVASEENEKIDNLEVSAFAHIQRKILSYNFCQGHCKAAAHIIELKSDSESWDF